MFIGKDLKDDPEYQARLKAGLRSRRPRRAESPSAAQARGQGCRPSSSSTGVALVVLFGFFPSLRTLPGAKSALAMPIVIEIVMMSVAAIMLAGHQGPGRRRAQDRRRCAPAWSR